jgi:hypothetical protein
MSQSRSPPSSHSPSLAFHRRRGHVAGQPLAQHRLELAELEEVVLGIAHHRRRAGDHRARILQVGGRVGRTAVLAVVAVLVRRAALRALALDVAVGQEHLAHRIVQLLDRALCDRAAGAQAAVDELRQHAVLFRMRGVVEVEIDAEGGEVALVPGLDAADELFRRLPGGLGASMIGVPWASSAQTKWTSPPSMRRARTQMSAWM